MNQYQGGRRRGPIDENVAILAQRSLHSSAHLLGLQEMACFRFVCAAGLLVGGSFAEPNPTVPSMPAGSAFLKPSSANDETMQADVDTSPDETTGFDESGPYLEEPSEDSADSPQPARDGWDNESSLKEAGGWNSWGRSFCEAHNVGYFCSGTTRVRCCSQTWGFVKCGTTEHSTGCGWDSGIRSYSSSASSSAVGWWQGGWHIHRGWRQSSFCTSHHVGYFCYSHHKVHCCNDYGHFVDCTTSSQTSWRC